MEPAKAAVDVIKSSKKKSPPSPHYLADKPVEDSCGCVIDKLSPKCSHDSQDGRWVVEWDGVFYRFIYDNQFQKDIWLGAAGIKNTDARIKLLRWFCSECDNVQEP